MVRWSIYIVLIIVIFPGTQVWTQNPGTGDKLPDSVIISRISNQIKFENYSSRDGLTQNSCFSIAQDSSGFMWFGTQDGLNRFDGNEFKVYLPVSGSGKELSSNHIWALQYREESDELWVGTYGGLGIYLPETDSIHLIGDIYPFARQLNSIPIRKIINGHPGHMWVITTNGGLIDLDIKEKKLVKHFDSLEDAGQVMALVISDNRIFAGLRNQIYMADADADILEFEPFGQLVYPSPVNVLFAEGNMLFIGTLSTGVYVCENMESGKIHRILNEVNFGGADCFEMEGEFLWIGTRGNGVIRYNIQTQEFQISRYNRYELHSIGSDFVLNLFLDKQNIMWCGLSGGGISKYNPLKFQFYNLMNEPLGGVSLPENMIYSIHRSENGLYYAGGQNKGLVSWDPGSDEIGHYMVTEVEGAPENKIFDIEEAGPGKLWIATWGGLFEFDQTHKTFKNCSDPEVRQSIGLLAVHPLSYNGKLFVSGDFGPALYDPVTSQWSIRELDFLQDFHLMARSIYEDENGILWICSERRSLVRLDPAGRQVSSIEGVQAISQTARHLCRSGDELWVATDQGIVVYDMILDTVLHHITLEDIGPSNVVYIIEQDAEGFFWAGTNLGLVKINPEDLSLRLYNLDNGLEFLEYNTACSAVGPDGTFAFGGVGGITFFHPGFVRTNHYSPTPVLTSVSVWDSQAGEWTAGSQRMSYDQNILTFHYTNNNFSNQRRDQFMCRLVGLNPNWYDNRNNYAATFNSLPPGNYTFQVKSANSDGIWAENPAEYSFSIVPPWWKSWWFLTLTGLLVIIIALSFMKWRIRNIRQKADLNNRIMESKMMALRAQMNPHSIFNCLNSIDAFIQSNDKYQATTYLNKFARLLRNVLDSSKKNYVKFSRDMETLKLYIELEELRNDHKFSTTFQIDDILMNDDYKVPPLLIQPYVENAIIHGLRNRMANGGKLLIKAARLPEYIHFTIEDNGGGRQAAQSNRMRDKKSYGMQMTSDRIRFFNEEEFPQVTITDLVDDGKAAGTRVEVFLKLK